LECVGIHAAKFGTRFEALEPIRQGVRHSFGAFGPAVAEGLTLRHDNGSQSFPACFKRRFPFWGIQSSPSFVREPQGNGIAERFVRTLKENLLWIRRFDTVEELRLALLEFKDTYTGNGSLDATATRPRQRCGPSRKRP
jgi:transposase InsO family protein